MESIKSLNTAEDFQSLDNNIEKILNDNVYHERDWNAAEIEMFVSQFNSFQDDAKETLIDMEKLDPNFVSEKEYKQKFSGFDDDTLAYMCKLENKKLEDARIPPLIVRNETVSLFDNLSKEIYKDEKTKCESTDSECDSDCESDTGRFEAQEKEKKKA
tara:strand:- start:6269 stop:6742 length:474 start_codon:yes stop_codon:yes gene_type:complete